MKSVFKKTATILGASLMLTACGTRMKIVHYHNYQPETQVWEWEYDNNIPVGATVSLTCLNEDNKCDKQTLVLNATVQKQVVEEANCCENGLIRYTATAIYNDTTYSKSLDYPVDKTSHNFESWYIGNDGHALKCSICGVTNGDVEPHAYGTNESEYYTCSICSYVDNARKKDYENNQTLNKLQSLINKVIDQTPKAYDEGTIRDADVLYSNLDESVKDRITNYDKYLTFKEDYSKKFEVIISDNLSSFGYNLETLNSEVEIKARRNQSSEYGYGYNLTVVTPSNKNALKINVSIPNYMPDDEYQGVFYTRNISSSADIKIINADSMEVIVSSTINEDLGNGWVERKLDKSMMANLCSNSFTGLYFQLGEEALSEGQYFLSNLYAVKPAEATSGVHYLAKESTTSSTGNKEYWVYDGREKVYLSNPNPNIDWRDAESETLTSSHIAFIPMKGTINVSTTSEQNWNYTLANPDNKHYVKFGLTPSLSEGGEYAVFRNYQWSDWKETQVGVTATYTLPTNDDMRYVNTFKMTYYSYNPVSPIQVTIEVLDQFGNKTEILSDTYTHTSSPQTETVSFENMSFKQLVITTKAFEAGKVGDSNICFKNMSLCFEEPISYLGKHYSAVKPTLTQSGNKEFWMLDNSDVVYFENPNPEAEYAEGNPSEIVDENHPAYLPILGTKQIDLTSSTNWTTSSSSSTIRMEYNQTIGSHTGCATFRNYQWTEWKENQLGLTAVYTNPENLIGANKVSFEYYVYHDNATYGLADLDVDIYLIDKFGNETLFDSFTIDKNQTGWINYSNDSEIFSFYQLKFVTTSEFITDIEENKGINTILYMSNLSVGYDSSVDVDYGEVNISSTDASSWSSSAIDATNKMFVGVPANYEQAKTGASGDYLCLRNYQWYDWTNKDKSSISASYTIDESKIINTVEFDYFIESASFEGKEMEVNIIVTDVNNVTKVVDNFVIANESVSKNTDIHYTNTIEDSVKIKEFSIKITTFDEDLSSGGKSSAIFIKNIKCSYSA